ncbi:MAG: multidrug efflux pump subunit AcrB, partial [Gammaproteobacteria bacterium]
NNLLQTVLVVLLVVMIALGWRTGLIVGAMVPLTMMATLIGMSLWGIELHRISIAAIIVALGLLVDNGVVVAEDIIKRLSDGTERLEACLATPRSLAVPLLTSSLTTIATFMPLVLITGGSGEFLRSLGQVLALALMASWLISITVTPAFCYWFLPKKQKAAGKKADAYSALPYRAYRSLLVGVLRFRIPFLVAVGALLVSSVIVLGFVKKRSLGPGERNQFTVYVDLPSEATIESTMAATERVVDFLQDSELNPEVTEVLSYVGHGGPRFFLGLSPNDPQPNKAFLIVNTQLPAQIYDVMPRVDRFLGERLPEGTGRTDILFLGSAPLGTVKLKVTGPEIDELRNIADKVDTAFRSVTGVRSVRHDWENSVLAFEVEIDQERARRAGVTSEAVAQSMSTYFDGANVTQFREGELTIPVTIRASAKDRAELDTVRTLEVLSTKTGLPVPLLQFASFKGKVEPSRIRRFNQERAYTVMGKHPNMTATELYANMLPLLDTIDLPPGYTLAEDGEIKDAKDSNAGLFEFAPHALLTILLLLVLQFNSFRRPLIILMTIPLVLIGANYGLYAFEGYFDFTAMLGLFSLAGIIINNGIVLIDKIDEERRGGSGVSTALIESCLARARPIIMTTVTTVVGLIPLALFGGEFWYGLAIVIMCGIAVGSLLTLAFVPVMYSLLFDFRKRAV